MKRIINNLTPQKQQYEIIKNKILTLKNWTRAFHRSSLLPAGFFFANLLALAEDIRFAKF